MRRTAAALVVLAALAASLRAQDATDAKADAAARVETARPQLARGSYFDAIANLKKAVAADPSNVEAGVLLGRALHDTGEDAKALEALAPLTQSAAALTLRAEILLAASDHEAAEKAARAAVELDAAALPALIVIG